MRDSNDPEPLSISCVPLSKLEKSVYFTGGLEFYKGHSQMSVKDKGNENHKAAVLRDLC